VRGMKRRMSAIVVFLAAFWVLSAFSLADASTQYTVRKGDTLSSISTKFHVSIKELRTANKSASRRLRAGMKIRIPGENPKADKHDKVHAVTARASAEPDTSGEEKYHNDALKSVKQVADNTYHTAGKGETLHSIAKKYSITVDELKELNNLKRSKLKKGQKILVKRSGPRTYTVKKGDTIWKIAKKFDMDADDLMEINEMESPSLKVGQKLYLQETADSASAEAYNEIITNNIEDELKKTAESEEVKAQDEPNRLVTFAKKLINIPYKFGGNSILGIDCSAYVKKVYGFLGIDLPRTAREQFNAGESIDKDELSIGDLVFFRTYASFPSHVGIYLGNNLFIHASSKGRRVTISNLETPYFVKRFIGAKRLLTDTITESEQ